MRPGRWLRSLVTARFFLFATGVVAASGCNNRLYDFGVQVVPDGSPPEVSGTDASRVEVGPLPDGSPTGAAGTGGHGGGAGGGGSVDAGGAGTGGTDAGTSLCDNNSPDRQTDIANCGTCFHSCLVPNSDPTCSNGTCSFTCFTDFYDADKDPTNGCECIQTNSGVEVCDGLDNNCNGLVDEGFDFMNDVNNCGGCNVTCQFPFAAASCVNGACKQGACLAGYYDRDPNVPGCETACNITNNGVEICDGLDNDCNGLVDDNPQASTVPCLSKGVCAGTQPVCMGQNGWTCTYPSTYQQVEDTSKGCDGLDNDCDGLTDEPFEIGKTCQVGTGPCAGTGTWVCDNTMAGNHRCMGSMKTPGVEVCNGIDDDCDGEVDELNSMSDKTADDVLIHVKTSTVDVTMYGYEATRYDATATSAGFDSTRRGCSIPGKLPWANVTMSEAQASCTSIGSGWRLCTAAEWQAACQGMNNTTFPYGNNYVAASCNGNDYLTGMGKTPTTIPTGSDTACASVISTNPTVALFDMSGNVKEWTATDLTTVRPASNPNCTTAPCLFEMRGGAYDISSFTVAGTTTAPGLQCNASVAAPSLTTPDGGTQGIDVRLPSVGFRCCYPGTLPP